MVKCSTFDAFKKEQGAYEELGRILDDPVEFFRSVREGE